MTKVLQWALLALMIILGVSNIALYTVARRGQSQQDRLENQVESERRTVNYEWRELQKSGEKSQEFADHLHAIDKRLDRLEKEGDDLRRAQNAIEGAQTEMRREMAGVRRQYDQIMDIIRKDEKARISADNAREIHNILKAPQ